MNPHRKQWLAELQPGHEVTRLLSTAQIPMDLKVTAIDDLIHCGPWTFHKLTGSEVDKDIGMDGVTITGSYITPRQPKKES